MADVQVAIVGAGAVGLAIAAELSTSRSPVVVLERNPKYGQETSSRNSEVIHAGIYYPTGSLKARLCVEGNRLLYEFGARYGFPHRRITKIITTTSKDTDGELERLLALGKANGAPLIRLSAGEVHALEPNIASSGGLLSPTTGIISAHGLMDFFRSRARANGAELQMRCKVVGIERVSGEYRLELEEQGERSTVSAEWVVNAAGLESDTVAALAGLDVDSAGYRLHWCKGSYFSLPGAMRSAVSRLVYPIPTPDSLGVHAVLDLGGRLRFGPDVEYLAERKAEYGVTEEKKHLFAESVRRILPFVKDEDLAPDISGIRPKLQARGGPPRDFVIKEESDRGLPGLINLVGIDSPGLTASPAIARHVAALMNAA